MSLGGELSYEDKQLLLLVLGFARGASITLKRQMPITAEAEMRILRRLGIENPEQYLTGAERAHVTP